MIEQTPSAPLWDETGDRGARVEQNESRHSDGAGTDRGERHEYPEQEPGATRGRYLATGRPPRRLTSMRGRNPRIVVAGARIPH
jgi:hypothetical protein